MLIRRPQNYLVHFARIVLNVGNRQDTILARLYPWLFWTSWFLFVVVFIFALLKGSGRISAFTALDPVTAIALALTLFATIIGLFQAYLAWKADKRRLVEDQVGADEELISRRAEIQDGGALKILREWNEELKRENKQLRGELEMARGLVNEFARFKIAQDSAEIGYQRDRELIGSVVRELKS